MGGGGWGGVGGGKWGGNVAVVKLLLNGGVWYDTHVDTRLLYAKCYTAHQ